MNNKLNHLAIIMDGNTRWAQKNSVSRLEGYTAGAENVWPILEHAATLGIKHTSLFVFSSENWLRPADEVSEILTLLESYLEECIPRLMSLNINLTTIGNLSKASATMQKLIANVSNATSDNDGMNVYIAFSYGSREEIATALQKAIDSKHTIASEKTVASLLYSPHMPDVDFMIRTSGVKRISNFLLWQSAYAELYFEEKLWPDFNAHDLDIACADFYKRKRNFGIKHSL